MTVRTAAAVTRRPERPGDAGLLLELMAQAKPELGFLVPALRDQLLEVQVRAQRQGYAATHPRATYEVLVAEGGAPVGRLVVDDGADEVRLVDVALLAGHQGRGTGSAVLAELQERAGARPVRLSVWSGNAGARRLYERHGFRVEPGAGEGHVEMTWRR